MAGRGIPAGEASGKRRIPGRVFLGGADLGGETWMARPGWRDLDGADQGLGAKAAVKKVLKGCDLHSNFRQIALQDAGTGIGLSGKIFCMPRRKRSMVIAGGGQARAGIEAARTLAGSSGGWSNRGACSCGLGDVCMRGRCAAASRRPRWANIESRLAGRADQDQDQDEDEDEREPQGTGPSRQARAHDATRLPLFQSLP